MENVPSFSGAAFAALFHEAGGTTGEEGEDQPDTGRLSSEAGEVSENLDAQADPEMELGDLLFAIVNVCRLSGKNPDIALFSATNKFISRFRHMENAIKKSGKCIEDLTLSEMDVYWDAGKRDEQRV